MLTTDKIEELMNKYDVQASFSHFSKQVTPPFITWIVLKENFQADNKVYSTAVNFQIELYTRINTLKEESKLEKYFDSCDWSWEYQGQTWLDEEKVMMSVYTVYG